MKTALFESPPCQVSLMNSILIKYVSNISNFTQFMRLEYITIYLLMKRIIIKMQNNINGHWHAMCVYIKKYVS